MGLKAKLPEVGLTKPNVLQHHSTTWISISQHHTPHHQGSPVIVMGRIKTKASIATTPPGGGGSVSAPAGSGTTGRGPRGRAGKGQDLASLDTSSDLGVPQVWWNGCGVWGVGPLGGLGMFWVQRRAWEVSLPTFCKQLPNDAGLCSRCCQCL